MNRDYVGKGDLLDVLLLYVPSCSWDGMGRGCSARVISGTIREKCMHDTLGREDHIGYLRCFHTVSLLHVSTLSRDS